VKNVVIIILYICLSVNIALADEIPREQLEKTTIRFLNNLKAENKALIRKKLFSKVELKRLKKDKITELVDDMIRGKMSIFDYLIKITGHNLLLFLQGNYRFIKYGKIEKIGKGRSLEKSVIKGDFYYIKLTIDFIEKGKTKIEKRLIEINMIQENNKYKVFAFVL